MMEKLADGRLPGIRDVIKTEESRVNYLRGLIRIAESDKNKTSGEEDYIYNIAEILNAPYSEIWKAEEELADGEAPEIHFETKREKTLFLMQALYLCWIDDEYSEMEREEIVRIGNEADFYPADAFDTVDDAPFKIDQEGYDFHIFKKIYSICSLGPLRESIYLFDKAGHQSGPCAVGH